MQQRTVCAVQQMRGITDNKDENGMKWKEPQTHEGVVSVFIAWSTLWEVGFFFLKKKKKTLTHG